MLGFIGLAAGLGGAILGRAMNAVTLGTGLFGSMVAVTGDAHQAQVAQDIFRADIRHELSLLVREDMRDVYALMSETVATQVTMGSICLGVCFGVFIEGYASNAESWILEFWAIFTAWAILFTLSSLLMAMWFQMSIKNAVRERLLLKHRIFMPNDTIISSLGGRNLAEQVGRLHARMVSQLVNLAWQAAMITQEGDQDGVEDRTGDEPNAKATKTGSFESVEGAGRSGQGYIPVEEGFNPGSKEENNQCDLWPLVRVVLEPSPQFTDREGESHNFERIVRARRNVQAWFDVDRKRIVSNKIVELPGFLVGGVLIRQPWRSENLEPLRLSVHDEATVYIAARVQDPEKPPGVKTGTWTQMLELNRVCQAWDVNEVPCVTCGARQDHPCFERVEGFSIFVDSHRIHLPLYRLPLQTPHRDGSPVDVEIKWRFKQKVEALTVIIREGAVCCPEDEYPKKAFLKEIAVLTPFMLFGRKYIQCGTSCLMLAVLWMHFSRVLPIRPFPKCLGEVCALVAAACVALVAIWTRFPTDNGGWLFAMDEERERDLENCVGTPTSRRHAITRKMTDVVPTKFRNKKFRTWQWFVVYNMVLAILFVGSLAVCVEAAIEAAVKRPSTREPVEPREAVWPWQLWPAQWPPMLSPIAATFDADGILWLASTFQLAAMRVKSAPDVGFAPAGVSLRQTVATAGIALLGDNLVAAGYDGRLRMFDPVELLGLSSSSRGSPDLQLVDELEAPSAPVAGPPIDLPQEFIDNGGSVLAGGTYAEALGRIPPGTNGTSLLATALSSRSLVNSAESDGIVLYTATGFGAASPHLEPLARLRPWESLSDDAIAGSRLPNNGQCRAMHICAMGDCSEDEHQLWMAFDGEDQHIVAVGLSSGNAVRVPQPWPREAKRRIVALTGNATHLLVIAESADRSSTVPEARTARYDLLISKTSWEL